jgi:hypothetical protein
MLTRVIYKRRKEKERRLAQLLLIATAVLAIGGAGITACFTAIGHVSCQNSLGKGGTSARDSTGMRKKWVLLIIRIVATARKWAVAYVTGHTRYHDRLQAEAILG